MDHSLDSCEEPDKDLIGTNELVELLKLGGFKLTIFVSSSLHLLDEFDNNFETVDGEDSEVIGKMEEEASPNALGLKWDHMKDTLVVSRETKYLNNKNVIQIMVPSLVSKVSETIHLVAPFTITAQLLLKD